MNSYRQLKDRQQTEVNEFLHKYAFFAFSQKQFAEGMERLNVEELPDLVTIPGGGFLIKEHADEWHELINRLNQEQNDAINADQTGDGFIYEMFLYELRNHEYIITYDVSDTLDGCGLTLDDLEKNPALLKGLRKAQNYIIEHDEF